MMQCPQSNRLQFCLSDFTFFRSEQLLLHEVESVSIVVVLRRSAIDHKFGYLINSFVPIASQQLERQKIQTLQQSSGSIGIKGLRLYIVV